MIRLTRQPQRKPPVGSRARGINGGLWLFNEPQGSGSFADATGANAPAFFADSASASTIASIAGPFGADALNCTKWVSTTNLIKAGTAGAVTDLARGISGTSPIEDYGPSNGFTIWAWLNVGVGSAVGVIASKSVSSATGWWFEIANASTPSQLVRFGRYRNGANDAYATTVSIPTGWVHVAAVFDPNATSGTASACQIYFNGVAQSLSVTNGSSGTNTDSTAHLGLLGIAATTGFASGSYKGFADHIGIDRRLYSPNEIVDLYQHPFRMFGETTPAFGKLSPSAFNLSVSETGSASDSKSASFPGLTVNESVHASDTNSASFPGLTVNESVHASDTESASFPGLTVNESAHASDTESSARIDSVAESGSATDHPNGIVTAHPTVTESGSAADHPGIVDLPFVSERMSAADTSNRTILHNKTVTETMHAADTTRQGIHLTVHEILNAVAHATESTDGIWHVRVREILAGIDAITVANHFNLIVRERGGPSITTQFASVDGVFNVFQHDRGGGSLTTQTAHLKATLFVSDSLSVQDGVRETIHPGIWNIEVDEHGHAVDTAEDPETFASLGIYFWGYSYFLPGFPTVAVWCAGLDCGDHPVNSDGSVFVPWQSDPDALFTPAWLMNISNNAPLNGFGASACNIDLTTNTGMIRVTVDLAIGLPYQSRLQLLRPNAPELVHAPYGPSLGETRRLHQFGAQLANAQGLSVGTDEDNLQPVVFKNKRGDKYLQSQLFTGVHWDLLQNDYSFDGMLMMQMFRPYPATIAALIGFMKTMDRD